MVVGVGTDGDNDGCAAGVWKVAVVAHTCCAPQKDLPQTPALCLQPAKDPGERQTQGNCSSPLQTP